MKHSLMAQFVVGMVGTLALFGCNSTDAHDNSIDPLSSSSQAAITESGKGVWKINGTLTADEDIYGVSFELYRGTIRIEGAIFADEVKDIKDDNGLEFLTELNFGAATDGVYGLDATIYQSEMGAVCAEGETTVDLTVLVTGKVMNTDCIIGLADTVDVEAEPMGFSIDCATEAIASGSKELTDAQKEAVLKDLEGIDPADALVESSFELGGAVASIGSSLDLDADKAYASSQVTSQVNDIGLVYSGTALMTPYGTQAMGYMANKYRRSTSAAMIFVVADTDAARDAKTVKDLPILRWTMWTT